MGLLPHVRHGCHFRCDHQDALRGRALSASVFGCLSVATRQIGPVPATARDSLCILACFRWTCMTLQSESRAATMVPSVASWLAVAISAFTIMLVVLRACDFAQHKFSP